MSTWLFSLDDGAAPLVITQHVEIPSINRERRLHTELKANVNVCAFRCRFDADLWSYLISSTSVQITITKDSAAYFAGYISPNFEATIRDGQKYIELRAEDYSLKRLGQTITSPLVCPGYAVCNPAAPAASIVHVIAGAAGVTVSPLVPTISTIVPYLIVLADDKTDYATVLGNVLFEHKHVYNVSESGLLDIEPYVNSGVITPAGTLSTAAGTRNLRGSLVQKKVAEKYDDIRVSYSEVELKSGLVLFQDTAGATAALACNIELAAAGDADGKDYYPKTADDGEVFASWKSPDGYDIWIATSAAMDVTLGSGIVVQRALTNYYRKCSFGYRNTAAAARSITKMRITGNAYVRTSKNTARVATSGAADLLEYDCQYVFSKADAQSLAAALAQYYRYSDMGYTAKSKTAFSLGAYVTVADPVYSGISTICRVVGIAEAEQQPGLYTYTLEGAADYESVAIVMEGESTPPSSPNIGGQTPQEVANAIELAQKSLRLSAPSITRSRAGALTPASITAEGRNADGTAYAGRLVIALSHDGGTTWPTVYTSSEDESSHEYTVPATIEIESVTYYVTAVRASLYAAGGTTTLLRETTVPVALDSSASAIYWGSYDSADDWPTSGMIDGDTLWDNRTTAAGGGILRYWDGANWSEMPDTSSGYRTMLWQAIPDMAQWSEDQAEVVAAASGIFAKLFAYDAYLANIFARTITVESGGRIRYETGAGVQKRAVQLADEKIDWLDTPDTTPASPEILRARIGRRGVGAAILMDGEISAPIVSGMGLLATLDDSVAIATTIFEQKDGTIRCAYIRTSDNKLVEQVSTDHGHTFSGESVIADSANSPPTYIERSSGEIRIAYSTATNFVERILSAGTWGAANEITSSTVSTPRYAVDKTGLLWVFYRQSSSPLLVVYKQYSASSWGLETPINDSASNYLAVIATSNAELRVAYVRTTSPIGLVEKIWDGTAWSDEISIEATAVSQLNYTQFINDVVRVSYYKVSATTTYYRDNDGSSWAEENELFSGASNAVSMLQLFNGNILLARSSAVDGYIYIYQQRRYAQIGAGIIESGYVSGRGWYVKYGDGTMEQWYYAQRGTSGYQTWTFPTPFIDTNITVHVTGNNSETESIAGNAGVPTAASCRWNCTRTDTGGYPTTAGRTALNATGRWKA